MDTSTFDNAPAVYDAPMADDAPAATADSSTVNQSLQVLSLPLLNLNAGREAVLAYFENTWQLTEQLFSGLNGKEAYYIRPHHKTRHPLIFYYAHPVCFYVNKLLVAGILDQAVNQEFELLFEAGVDEMNWDDLHDGELDNWPDLEDVIHYRQCVYELVKEIILRHPSLDDPITMDSPAWALVMGFEHERIHLETSSVLMRELPIEHLKPVANWPILATENSPGLDSNPIKGVHYPADNEFREVAETSVNLGKPRQWPTFGWDNEYGSDKRHVTPFKASKYLICNGEFFEFVVHGYQQEKYWSKDGWNWRIFRNAKWPTFWVQEGPAGSHRFKLRTTFTVENMQWSWPAIVNYYEAKAYCLWKSDKDKLKIPYRLLQEKEHLAINDKEHQSCHTWQPGNSSLLSHDKVMLEEENRINHNLQFGSETPVNYLPANESGFHDTMGNVWQWSDDAFHPLPGFETHPYYTDFSTPCFDDQHQMILGGSFISTGEEASLWSRFHFRPHFFQHAGFRMVLGNEVENKYESNSLVDQYMLFHWGSDDQQRDEEITANVGHPNSQNFILRTVDLINQFSERKNKVLDLGCAVGRASLELSKSFPEVIGIDYSQAFIDVAVELQTQGQLSYARLESGSHSTQLQAQLDSLVQRDHVEFQHGDASNLSISKLKTRDNKFDAVLLSNLLCRLQDPSACLNQFVTDDTFLASGGVLVIVSPNTWMSQYTPPGNWLDGACNDDALVKLASILKGFTLVHQEDIPFMIREHRRKYEYIISQASVWKKL